MNKLFRVFAPLALAVALAGCSLIPDSAVTADAKKAVAVSLASYADIYQPAVIAYGHLQVCPDPTPSGTICHSPAILTKLKAIDLATTTSIVAAKDVLDGKTADTGQELTTAINAITAAEVQIASTGVITTKGN